MENNILHEKTTIECPHCKKSIDLTNAMKKKINDQRKIYEENQEREATEKLKQKLHLIEHKIRNDIRAEEEQKGNIYIERKLNEHKRFYESKIEELGNNIEKERKEKEIIKKRMAKKSQEMNSMARQGSVELQGEVQEETIEDYLLNTYKEDDLEVIKKGAKGGDCILKINHKGRKNISQIYFESKNQNSFKNEWIPKFLKDMKEKSISYGIMIVSPSCYPKDLTEDKGFVERHGNSITIIPYNKRLIHAVVNNIRNIIVSKFKENKHEEIPQAMRKCWENINSPKFQHPIRLMISEIKNMDILLQKDKNAFELAYSKKRKTLSAFEDNLHTMVTSFIENVSSDILPENILDVSSTDITNETKFIGNR